MLYGVDSACRRVPPNADDVPGTRHELVSTVPLGLAKPLGIESPDTRLADTLRTGIQACGPTGPGEFHTRVGRCSEVDIHVAGIIDSERLVSMTSLLWKATDHELGLARRNELTRRHRIAVHLGGRRKIQMVATQLETRPVVIGELLDDVSTPVAVQVAKRDDAVARHVLAIAAVP